MRHMRPDGTLVANGPDRSSSGLFNFLTNAEKKEGCPDYLLARSLGSLQFVLYYESCCRTDSPLLGSFFLLFCVNLIIDRRGEWFM